MQPVAERPFKSEQELDDFPKEKLREMIAQELVSFGSAGANEQEQMQFEAAAAAGGGALMTQSAPAPALPAQPMAH